MPESVKETLNFYIGAYFSHQFQQGKVIECAHWMIRNYNDPAMTWNSLHVTSADLVGKVEIPEYFVDKVKPFQMGIYFSNCCISDS